MKEGSKIYSLEALTGDPLATRNTQLFAALTALNILPELSLCGEYVEKVGEKTVSVTVWRLQERSIDGRYDTAEMIAKWHDPKFVEQEPEHPLAYLKCAFGNYRGALEFIREQGPIVIRRRGKKIGLITRHTPPERREKILEGLNA